MAKIKGSNRSEKLSGTKHSDTILGRGGNDRIDGGKGDDLIFGGSGKDRLDGGKGNDFLFGGSGRDRLDGGKGDDKLVGGRGGDALTGGRGMDLFAYLAVCDSTIWDWDCISDFRQGEDKIDLSSILGASDLNWGGETPTANGVWFQSSGCSTLVFVDADDDGKADMKIELKNTAGLELNVDDFLGVSVGSPLFAENDDSVNFNDIFAGDYTGGTQYDALGGNDSVTLPADAAAAVTAGFDPAQSFSGGAGDDRITMFVTNPLNVDGGPNNDTLNLTGDVPGDPPIDVVVIDLSAPDQVVSIGGVNDGFVQMGFENIDASGLGSSVQVTADEGGNVIVGSHGADVIDGGDGNDTIAGGPGHDTIKGGAGDDHITMLLTAGDADEIDAGDGNDTLYLSGNVAGVVQVQMSAFDQVLFGSGKQTGFENLDASALGAGNSVDVTSNVKGAIITGSSGDDMFNVFLESTVLGGPGNDVFFLGQGPNSVSGGPGDDTFLSGPSADTFGYSFELVNDEASSYDGHDLIIFFGGPDKMRFDFSADQGWDAGLADDSAKLDFLEDLFMVNAGTIALDDGTWSVNAGSLSPTDPFAAVDMYVNDVLIG